MIVLVVAAGAAVGAPARYVVDRAIQSRHRSPFPWGTLAVNVVASFVLGIATGAAGHLSADVQALVATGFCGAMSTFSSFGYEVVQLARRPGTWRHAVGTVALSVVGGVGAAALGWLIGSAA